MFKIDDNYSDYHTIDPVKYPGGAAINSSGVDTTDGTPWLAKMFNNCVGWMQALYIKAFGSLTGISNDAENAQTSDVVRALEKIQTDNNAAERATSEAAYFKKSGGTINGNVDVNGQLTAKDSTIDGALHVKSDLLVDGTGKEIISTELNVGADTIKLRKDNPTGLTPSELAGVITENYDGQGNNNILAVDKDGNARVGDIDIATRLLYSNDGTNFFEDEALTITATIGQDEIVRDTGNTTSGGVKIYEGTTFSNDDTEALATREDNPAAGGFAKWNAGAKRFDAVVPDAAPTAGSQNLATSGGIFAAVAAASNNFILAAQGAADAQKTIDLPGGQISEGQTVTVNFKNGHAMIYNNPMRLNNILVVSNQNGTLAPIPLHAMTEGGQTVYKVLDPNTILSLYYTADYDGNETPAWVIVGNPLVLSSSSYSIYANGSKIEQPVDSVTDGDLHPVTSNAVYDKIKPYDSFFNYSYSETFIGKYWVDGRKIYRKIIPQPSLEQILATNVSELISFIFKRTWGYGYTQCIYYDSGYDRNSIMFKVESGNLSFERISSNYSASPQWIIIEYTKIT